MSKSKLDYKLVNLVLISLLIYLIYQTRSFWLGVVSTLKEILLPFFIGFIIAYVLNALVSSLVKHNISRKISILIVLGLVLSVVILLIYLITPVLVEQIGSLFNGISSFFKELTTNYNLEFGVLEKQLTSTFNNALEKIGTIISNGAINIIGASINIISQIFIVVAAAIYFLIDMEKIKASIKKVVISKNKRLYHYLSLVDNELNSYMAGFLKITIISFFEYFILYFIVGHPNALMLGVLASFGNLIPYFGGISVNIIAAITAFVIGPDLFIKTISIFIIFSAIDGYVINPWIYGKSNKIHPLVVIISVFAGGILGGLIGIVLSLPLAIIMIATYKFYKQDIDNFSKKTFIMTLRKK